MAESANNLFDLLNFVSSQETLNHEAIIKEVQQNPHSAGLMYSFSHCTFSKSICHCYPLHQAIMLRSPLDVIGALYDSYTPAIKEKARSATALHLAIRCKATPDVLSYLFSKWPEAAQVRDEEGRTLLHLACCFNKPLDIVSMLLNASPEAAREKDTAKLTPLHYACIDRNVPVEIVSLLLEVWPKRLSDYFTPLHFACLNNVRVEVISLLVGNWPREVKYRDGSGSTPLHYACKNNASFEVILRLLEKWPQGSKSEDDDFMTPLDYCRKVKTSAEDQKILSCISKLCDNQMQEADSKVLGRFFVDINWWDGIVWILDKYPLFVKDLDIDTKAMPYFLSMAGKCCKRETMWRVLSNNQELMTGA